MKNNPKISILVPIYNVEKYLEECLKSLQNQTFANFEVLCLNDGSTDGSKEIIDTFAAVDERFVLVDKPNSGYGATMNKGLSLARGECVAILESDDKMFPNALDTLYSLQQKFDADVVKGDYCLYWSEPTKKEQKRNMFPVGMTGKLYDTRTLEYIYLQEASIWSALYKREFLEQHKITFLETPGASYQDTSFAFKVWASAERAVFSDVPIIAYRQDNENSSVKSKDKAFYVCREYKEIFEWLKQYGPKDLREEIIRFALISKYNAYLWNLDRLSNDNKLEFLENMRNEFMSDRDSGLMNMANWSYWRCLNLQAIFADPKKYLEVRNSSSDRSAFSKTLFAFRLGGVKAVVMAIKNRKASK